MVATAMLLPIAVTFPVLLLAGYRSPSLFVLTAGTSCVAVALLVISCYVLKACLKWFEDILNKPGGGPKGPHPLPANDALILNRRRD